MEYYVYISTEERRACPHFKELKDALECFKENEMKKMRDNVFLGIEGTAQDTIEFFSFDVVHKMFGDNCLINDYMNHESEEITNAVNAIIDSLPIKYQFTSDILGGALIDFASAFATVDSDEILPVWTEAYIQTIKDGEINVAGWHCNDRRTWNLYSWQYPEVYPYVSLLNVTVTKDSIDHYMDMDPRIYLKANGKKVTLPKVAA